jgi:pimeloyl-ACP methyl ester carboxylesterase
LAAKGSKLSKAVIEAVRTRRAYFDCRFGQLHVRTAFPTTGGFDEQVTLICVHPEQHSSRIFARFLPTMADVRSVYAPDLPGWGESDPSPAMGVADAAGAIADLASDLRLRQIDLLSLHSGGACALELAAARPELVRRLLLVGIPTADRLPQALQPSLVLRTGLDTAASLAKVKAALPNGKFVDMLDYEDGLFDVAPNSLAKQFGDFLSSRA